MRASSATDAPFSPGTVTPLCHCVNDSKLVHVKKKKKSKVSIKAWLFPHLTQVISTDLQSGLLCIRAPFLPMPSCYQWSAQLSCPHHHSPATLSVSITTTSLPRRLITSLCNQFKLFIPLLKEDSTTNEKGTKFKKYILYDSVVRRNGVKCWSVSI